MEVLLTFDDGPQPRWTAEVLDALARAGARATFFVLAARAVREPGLVERTPAEGDDVQLHGNHHLRHTEHGCVVLAHDGLGPGALRDGCGATARDREPRPSFPTDAIAALEQAGGLLLAVHWRPPTQTHPLRGDEVHAILAGRPALRGIHAESHDRDRLDVLERT